VAVEFMFVEFVGRKLERLAKVRVMCNFVGPVILCRDRKMLIVITTMLASLKIAQSVKNLFSRHGILNTSSFRRAKWKF
jgi:hypothetical protein